MKNFTTHIDVNSVKNFLSRYKTFSNRLEQEKILYYKTKYIGLLSGYSSLRNVINSINEKEASQYNIFQILNIRKAEVITHTPFLINLLKPNGSHGQKDLFLKSFIQKFIHFDKRENFIMNNIADYILQEEKPIVGGRIDIYIQSFIRNKRFGIVIENKLNASDQKNQLERYYYFMKNSGYTESQMQLIYLTIEGYDPSTYSINQDLMNNLKANNILKSISYKNDITNWLENILIEIKSDKVKYSIEQYIQTIKQF